LNLTPYSTRTRRPGGRVRPRGSLRAERPAATVQTSYRMDPAGRPGALPGFHPYAAYPHPGSCQARYGRITPTCCGNYTSVVSYVVDTGPQDLWTPQPRSTMGAREHAF
jgi:hypothetical protein